MQQLITGRYEIIKANSKTIKNKYNSTSPLNSKCLSESKTSIEIFSIT